MIHPSVSMLYRWQNHLSPNINKEPWTDEEETTLLCAQLQHGNRWADISKMLPGTICSENANKAQLSLHHRCCAGRPDNAVKNHWNSFKRRLSAEELRRRAEEAAAASPRGGVGVRIALASVPAKQTKRRIKSGGSASPRKRKQSSAADSDAAPILVGSSTTSNDMSPRGRKAIVGR